MAASCMNIVIIEPDFVSRNVLRTVIKKLQRGTGWELKIYSSANGVEGLGHILLTKPDIIILNADLPGYSSEELVTYLHEHKDEYHASASMQVVLLYDQHSEDIVEKTGDEFVVINKNNRTFINSFFSFLEKNLQYRYIVENRELHQEDSQEQKLTILHKNLLLSIGSRALYYSYRSLHFLQARKDNTHKRASFSKKALWRLGYMWFQMLTSLSVTIFRILGCTIQAADENTNQLHADTWRLRTRYYPAFATTLGVFILQFALFVTGGLAIMGLRPGSSQADHDALTKDIPIALDTARYDQDAWEVHDGYLHLREISAEKKAQPAPTLPAPTPPAEEVNEETTVSPTTAQPSPTEGGQRLQPTLPAIPEQTPDALAAHIEEDKNAYKPGLFTVMNTEPVQYCSLIGFKHDISADTTTGITYQLSPNGEQWYYHTSQGWEQTELGHQSSNTPATLDQHIASVPFPNDCSAPSSLNPLYIRAFITSTGTSPVTIKNISIKGTIEPLPEEDNEEESTAAPIEEETTTETSPDGGIPAPVLFNASFYKGNKLIYGKILDTLPHDELNKYEVTIYYSKKEATANKEKVIGSTLLHRNERGEIAFFLKQPEKAGGYVTADLTYFPEGIDAKDTKQTSPLAQPLENSTFTVDSTGDEVDHTPNGVCSVGTAIGGPCTLRAAMLEANRGGSLDNIYFNIPTTDPGFIDYDTPSTPSSGVSGNGKSYWSIPVSSSLPTLHYPAVIDARTQTANQGDTNDAGPEVEVTNGTGSELSRVLVISSVTVAGFSFNGFNSQISLALGSGNTIEDNYLCSDIRGNLIENQPATGITTQTDANNLTVRNNLFSSCTGMAAQLSGDDITVQGNRFGTDRDISYIPYTPPEGKYKPYGLYIHGSNITIGGSAAQDRNYFAGFAPAIYISGDQITISNNYFNVDGTGTTALGEKDSRHITGGITNFLISHNILSNASTSISLSGSPNSGIIEGNIIGSGINKTENIANSHGIYISSSTTITIRENFIAHNTAYGIQVQDRPSQLLTIENNEIVNGEHYGVYFNEYGSRDPLSPGPMIVRNNLIDSNGYGIVMNGSAPQVYGNEITNNIQFGVLHQARTFGSRTAPILHGPSRAIIGGSQTLAGSRCNGTEQNCISGNGWGGIYSYNCVPWNETTLFTDNDFGAGDGGDNERNIEQVWQGAFELFSGSRRRTDLPSGSLTIDFPDTTLVRGSEDPADILTSGTVIIDNCNVATDCPENGATSGIAGKSAFLGGAGFDLSYGSSWLRITEYTIGSTGTKNQYGTFTFATDDVSSQTFSFDGDSTSHPQDFPGRGEPWTNSETASRDVLADSDHFGLFQLMEVEITSISGSVAIQDDPQAVNTPDIELALSAQTTFGTVDSMIISNTSDFSGATWEPYTTEKQWQLPAQDGEHTVYVKFRDSNSNESPVYTASVLYDSTLVLPTFIVNSTGDEADHTRNGVCSIGVETGGPCTLRAAIQEANSLDGKDVIHFNIPTTDPGFIDYDTPDTPASGNVSNGKSFWRINLQDELVMLLEAVIIDASSQTVNVGDTNNKGPEVLLFDATTSQFGIYAALKIRAESSGSTIQGLGTHGFTNGIYGYPGAHSLTIKDNYLGTDMMLENVKVQSNDFGIYLENSSNITIEGNVIDGWFDGVYITDSTQLYFKNNRFNTSYQDNYVGGVSLVNSSDITIGGDAYEDKNIFGGLQNTLSLENTQNIEVKYNHFGVNEAATDGLGDVWGDLIKTRGATQDIRVHHNIFGGEKNTGILLDGEVDTCIIENNTFGTGYAGTENIGIRTSIYQDSDYGSDPASITTLVIRNNVSANNTSSAIQLRQSPITQTTVEENDLRGGDYLGIYVLRMSGSEYDTPRATNEGQILIQNNSISNYAYGVYINAMSPTIIGNRITNSTKKGIFIRSHQDGSRINPTFDFVNARPQIGGTASLSGSLCNGKEQNCISGNAWGGIYSEESVPWNEASLFTDNDFSSGNGIDNNNNIEQTWNGAFELFTGNQRRTDIPDEALTVTLPSNTIVRESDDPDSRVTQMSNYSLTCNVPEECPETGSTSGLAGKSSFLIKKNAYSSSISSSWRWYSVTEYIIDGTGTKTDYSTFSFNRDGFSSPTFSFDGNSTTHPQDFPGRGEPWTDDETATRTVQGDSHQFGRFQIMEVDVTSITGSIAIQGNPTVVNSPEISLTLEAASIFTTVEEMMISNTSDFSGATWEPYTTEKQWMLSDTPGEKVVYATFKESTGFESEVYSVSVLLDTELNDFTIDIINGEEFTESEQESINSDNGSIAIGGTVEEGSTVIAKLIQDGESVVEISCTVHENRYECDMQDIPDGEYQLVIEATDPAGNKGVKEIGKLVFGDNPTDSPTPTPTPTTTNTPTPSPVVTQSPASPPPTTPQSPSPSQPEPEVDYSPETTPGGVSAGIDNAGETEDDGDNENGFSLQKLLEELGLLGIPALLALIPGLLSFLRWIWVVFAAALPLLFVDKRKRSVIQDGDTYEQVGLVSITVLDSLTGRIHKRLRSSAFGYFALRLPAGTYTLQFTKRGYASYTAEVTVKDSSEYIVRTFHMRKGEDQNRAASFQYKVMKANPVLISLAAAFGLAVINLLLVTSSTSIILVAVAGVGFGVYAIMHINRKVL